MMRANNNVKYDPMVVFVCLHITLPYNHYYAHLSESIELLKWLSGTFCLERVSKSTNSIIISHFSHDRCENARTLSNYHHQIGSIAHLSLFMARLWNNDVRCMYFYILTGHGLLNDMRHGVISQFWYIVMFWIIKCKWSFDIYICLNSTIWIWYNICCQVTFHACV